MALDFAVLCPQIERVIDRFARIYQSAQGILLTEEDLRWHLISYLHRLPGLRTVRRTQDRKIRATSVHAQLSWYDEAWRLSIVPDITILEPEHLSILQGYEPLISPPFCSASTRQRRSWRPQGIIDPFAGSGSLPRRSLASRPLPSKQFEFGGKAITIELKFARKGIDNAVLKSIKKDFEKMNNLFAILDSRNDGDTVFSYLVIFDKYQQNLTKGSFAKFYNDNEQSYRHKIIYKSGNVRKPLR